MRYFFITFIAILFLNTSWCQIYNTNLDTSKIYNCKVLKKGFYKSFNEYLNNAPSLILPFTNELICKSEKDSTIVAGIYTLIDSTKKIDTTDSEDDTGDRIPHIWGYCDGKNVFITQGSFLTAKHNWRLR